MDRFYRELESYYKQDIYPFHMPGHKRNQSLLPDSLPVEMDITEITGFDNLHQSEGILKKAQQDAASLFGAKETFFSINGSTAALLSAISACVKKGGKLIMARNCHKAVYHAVYLRELHPLYVYPQEDATLQLNGGISPARVERLLESDSEIQAVVITSPTYDGIVSDVKAIAEAAHRHGVPLIVDEAHGSHFLFSGYFPESALRSGADVVIQSTHKTLLSMTQTALLHVCLDDRVDIRLLRRFMGMYQSSSPSYVLMASLDACMEQLKKNGNALFRTYTAALEQARKRLSGGRQIRLMTPQKSAETGVFDFDRSKILLSTNYSPIGGADLFRILREEFHLELEMNGLQYVLALSSVGDTREGFSRLCDAVEEIDRSLQKNEGRYLSTSANRIAGSGSETEIAKQTFENPYQPRKQILSIADAMDSPTEVCSLEEAAGRISAAFISFYPPGIPLIVPGEQISGRLIRNLYDYRAFGMTITGLEDKETKIRVLK